MLRFRMPSVKKLPILEIVSNSFYSLEGANNSLFANSSVSVSDVLLIEKTLVDASGSK